LDPDPEKRPDIRKFSVRIPDPDIQRKTGNFQFGYRILISEDLQLSNKLISQDHKVDNNWIKGFIKKSEE